MFGNMEDEVAGPINVGKTILAVTAPLANAWANAAVLEKIEKRKPSRSFPPQEEHGNELAISLSKQKGQR
ncbi:hypothetical protein Bca4012_010504 [Brassica carinata]